MRPPTTTSPDETIKWRVKLMVLEKWGTRGERIPPPPPTHTARYRSASAVCRRHTSAKHSQSASNRNYQPAQLYHPFPPLPQPTARPCRATAVDGSVCRVRISCDAGSAMCDP